MKPATQKKFTVEGPAGRIEGVIADPGAGRRGIAVIAHPHPLFGGTMDNKVVQTLARTFTELGYVAVRFNFRGVGESEGVHDDGRGETEDVIAVAEFARQEHWGLPVLLAGFSFGGFVQARVASRIEPERLVLIAPAVKRFDVPQVPASTLVVHGELDDVVPLQDVLDWARPQELPVIVIPGGEHFFHGRLHLLKRIIHEQCRS
ncbi:MAG: alpha/beta hydrolase [Betaproteobacteria bacterium]|nr:alpha/beta hydrolase [Betaproteobacteria bacterium]